jgi:uncharacterized protein YgbK (DUF1537 family)
VRVLVWPDLPEGDGACWALDTESRQASPEVAFQRSRAAHASLYALGVPFVYRKVDSQVRCNLGSELAGALAAQVRPCVLAPALPEEGRLTVAGVQRWNGKEVDLVALLSASGLRARTGRPADVEDGTVMVCDAGSRDDLRRLAGELAGMPAVLPAGTAGLAMELPAALGWGPAPLPGLPRSSRPLAVVGSPKARAQALYAEHSGERVLMLSPGRWPASPAELGDFDALVLSGGETAARVLGLLGAGGLELLGEIAPRVPAGRILRGPFAGLPVALKSGAFGPLEILAEVLARMRRDG